MSAPADKLAILLWGVSPGRPELCAAPFVYAAVAAALDCEVEIHFAGAAVRLLRPGVAATLFAGGGRDKSVYAFMQEAAAGGARFLGCSMALHEHFGEAPKAGAASMIPEYHGPVGAAAFVARTLAADWRTLVF
jgi:uncharacterized protein